MTADIHISTVFLEPQLRAGDDWRDTPYKAKASGFEVKPGSNASKNITELLEIVKERFEVDPKKVAALVWTEKDKVFAMLCFREEIDLITTLSLYPRFAHSRPTMTNLLLERWIPTNSSYISGKPVEVTSREQVKLPIDGSSASSLHGKNKFNYVEFVHDLFCSGWMPHTVSQGAHCVMVRFYTQLETERYVKENADEEVELRPIQGIKISD